METKVCPKCDRELDVEEFTKHRSRKGGRYPYCKTCRAVWYQTHKEYARKAQRKYREENVATVMVCHARKRARLRGIPFSLTASDVSVPQFCPVLGMKMEIGRGTFTPSSPTLDRVDPSKGYEPGNVAVISFRANLLKNNAEPEELERVAEWMRSNDPRFSPRS